MIPEAPREQTEDGYVANQVAVKHHASARETTQDACAADVDVPESKPARYDGWLPGD